VIANDMSSAVCRIAKCDCHHYIALVLAHRGWLGSQVVSAGLSRCRVTVLGKLLTPIGASVHQAAKLVAALLRVAGVTVGLCVCL